MVRKLIVATGVLAILAAVLLAQEGTKPKPKLEAVKEKLGAARQAVKEKVKEAAKGAKEAAKEKLQEAAKGAKEAAKEKLQEAVERAEAAKEVAEAGDAPIDKAVQSYAAAFNKNDAAATAAHWAETGVYVDRETGARTEGRDAIQADFETLFKERTGARLAIELTDRRLIKPDVASIEGNATASLPGEESSTTAFSAILVRQGEQWLIDSVHESPQATPPTAHDALADLEWLLGRWLDESETTRVETNVRFGAGNSFLVRSFVVQAPDEEEEQGTQVIGWDPRLKQIRSWSFFSDGSFGDGLWSKSGNDWLVKGTHTLADGRVASGTQVVEREGNDTLHVRLIGREIDGEPQPNSEPVRVVRAAGPEATEVGAVETAAPPASDAKDVADTKEVDK